MSKSKKHNKYFFEEEDEDFYGSDSDYRNRKKEKRISTALKRKDRKSTRLNSSHRT